jgi:ribosome-interacting GTPase 1
VLLLLVDLTEDPVFQMEVLLEELNRMRIKIVGKGLIPPEEGGWVSHRALLLANKCDIKNAIEAYRTFETHFMSSFPILPISAKEGMNLEELKKEVYQLLHIVRVYTKPPGGEPDLTEPVILRRGSTVEDVAFSIHKDFAAKLRYARIWGSGKFGGQMVKRDYEVNEGDVIELHI